MFGKIVAFAPMLAPRSTTVVSNFSGNDLEPGKRSFENVALGPTKDVIPQSDTIPQLGAALQRHAVPYHDIVFDEHVIANVTISSDPRAGQNMRKRPDSCTFAY